MSQISCHVGRKSHFDWNVPGASFVVGVGTLADVKDITDLLLGQISVCPKVLNSLKFQCVSGIKKNKSKKDMIKRYTKFIIAHFALNCNSAFRSDLYFLKGFGARRFSLFVTFGSCRLYRRKRGEPMKFQKIADTEGKLRSEGK